MDVTDILQYNLHQKKINSQIQYPGYRINRSYDQATRFLGNDFLGCILIYDQENRFLGNVFTEGETIFLLHPQFVQAIFITVILGVTIYLNECSSKRKSFFCFRKSVLKNWIHP